MSSVEYDVDSLVVVDGEAVSIVVVIGPAVHSYDHINIIY